MTRSLSTLVISLVLGGCAGVPTLPGSCPSAVVNAELTDAVPDQSACAVDVAERDTVATLGSIRQTGSQTRTVGVPRGFLVAMILLILLVGLA